MAEIKFEENREENHGILKPPKPKITNDEAIVILTYLRDLYNSCNSDRIKEEITKELAVYTLYHASETRSANYVSERALVLWNEKMETLLGEIKNLTVPKQRAKKKKHPILAELLLEHCNPIGVLVKRIFEIGEEIPVIVEKHLITCWVLNNKSECGKGSEFEKKYKSNRGDNWHKCYDEFDIKIKPL